MQVSPFHPTCVLVGHAVLTSVVLVPAVRILLKASSTSPLLQHSVIPLSSSSGAARPCSARVICEDLTRLSALGMRVLLEGPCAKRQLNPRSGDEEAGHEETESGVYTIVPRMPVLSSLCGGVVNAIHSGLSSTLVQLDLTENCMGSGRPPVSSPYNSQF